MMLRIVVLTSVVAMTCAPARGDEEAKPVAKTFAFQMKDAKWDDVLDWYAKVSECKADVRVKPTGTFTCLLRKDRQFTIGEITDLINGEWRSRN